MEATNEELLKSVNVLVATPCYGGMCASGYMLSMTGLAAISARTGIKISMKTIVNESVIHRARNTLLSDFISEPSFTHIMFIDADIEFNPHDVIKLILRDKDVIGGIYPTKTILWDNIKNNIKEGISVDDIKRLGSKYTYGQLDKDGRYITEDSLSTKTEVHAVDRLATGFMLIKRNVIDTIVSAQPDDWYLEDGKLVYEVFNHGIDKVNRQSVGEDWMFCAKWKSLGGELFIDSSIDLNHIGTYSYSGKLNG